MSSTKRIAVGVLLTLLSGCDRCRPPETVVPRKAASIAVRAALASIYYYALGLTAADGPYEPVPAMGIVAAARILREAPSPDTDTYRRRAIGMLVTAGIPPTTLVDPWAPREVQEALEAIGAPIEALTRAFLAQRERRGSTAVDKQWVAYQTLNVTAGPWQRKCCSCLESWDVDPDPNPVDDVALAYFKIAVQRSYKDVRPLMDPQSWSACSPDFFKSTLAIQKGKKAPCLSGSPCTTAVPPAATPAPSPSSIWEGTLFEHYRNAYASGAPCSGLPGNHGELYVRNVLRIEKSRNTANTKDQIDYGVCGPKLAGPPTGSIDSAIDCNCEQYGVDVDCGRTLVYERTKSPIKTSTVEGTKHLKFSPRSINYDLRRWAAAGLKMMIDEIVEEGVCCGVTGSVSTCNCRPPNHVEGFTPPTIPLCGP